MLGRIAASAALIAVASCAGMESAGRNSRVAEPTRVASAPAPAPTISTPPPAPITSAPLAPAPQVAAAPSAPAPTASAPPAYQPSRNAPPVEEAPVAAASSGLDETVVVPGMRERQVQPPSGDPRSNSERMQDIRAWDRCVSRVQDAVDGDPMSPQLDSPEDYCSQSLGMANRNSIPQSRLERSR